MLLVFNIIFVYAYYINGEYLLIHIWHRRESTLLYNNELFTNILEKEISQWRISQIKMKIINKLLVTKQSMGCTANIINIFVTTVGE